MTCSEREYIPDNIEDNDTFWEGVRDHHNRLKRQDREEWEDDMDREYDEHISQDRI